MLVAAHMQASPTASVLLIRTIVEGIVARGVAAQRLLAPLGIAQGALGDPDGRVPHTVLVAAWEAAPALTGDPDFGLHLAESVAMGTFDVLDYVIRHSATLGGAYEAFLRYQRLVHTAAGFGLDVQGGVARMSHLTVVNLPIIPRQAAEFMMANLLVRWRRITGQDWSPTRVLFRHAAPADTSAHRKLFRAPVLFDQAVNGMDFDAALLRLPVLDADPALGAVLARHAAALVERLPPEDDFLGQVRHQIGVALRGSAPSVDEIARGLGLSRRSLQRRLGELGTRYQDLVDAARKDIALRQIRARTMALSEVAFLLGFSEVSAFHRAFRRWTGMTPTAYLRSMPSAR
jgi:AraC-like DNA-binding protein